MYKNKLKPISLFCMAAGIYACASGEQGSRANSDQIIPEVTKPKVVSISRTSIIPTNLGVGGNHSLRVDNFTGRDLKLTKATISGTDGKTNNTSVNTLACSVLQANSSCAISATPDQEDGSISVVLDFTAENGEKFSAAQLVEYSSNVEKANGFVVSNANITSVASTNPYSLSIPFVSDDDYKKIEVLSKVITLSNSVDCASGATKGTHCTANLTLPAGPAKSYDNTITIRGTKADGTVRSVELRSGNIFNNYASLAITHGPLSINKDKKGASKTATVHIVNNGINLASNIVETLTAEGHWLNGVVAKTDNLNKKITCDGSVVTQLTQLDAAKSCEVEFTMKDMEATGSASYQLSYTGGLNGLTQQYTKIYYNGNTMPEYGYTLSGNIDFSNTKVNSTVLGTIKVTNIGSATIKGLEVEKNFPPGFTLNDDSAVSTCLNPQIKNNGLSAAGGSCNYSIKYKPLAEMTPNSFEFKVSAKKSDGTTSVQLTQSRLIKYSAKDQNVNGLVITRTSNNGKYSIPANNKDSISDIIKIQNVGSELFNLSSIKVSTGSFPASNSLQTSAPAKLSTTSEDNPFAGITFANGSATPHPLKPLAANAIAELKQTYGPVAQAENDSVSQSIIGSFDSSSGLTYQDSFTTEYKAIASVGSVSVEAYAYLGQANTPQGTTDTLNSYPLSAQSEPTRAKFVYKFQGTVHGFLIDEANLPFGWSITNASNCPYLSSTTPGRNKRVTYRTGEECYMLLSFMNSTLLSHSYFYTAATASAQHVINAPRYSLYDDSTADGKNNGISIISPTEQATIKPIAFAKVSATQANPIPGGSGNNTYKVYKVTFKLDSYAGATILNNDPLIVKPHFTNDIYPVNTASCQLAAIVNSTCDIDVVVKDAQQAPKLPYTYHAATKEPDYHAVDSSITF